jgi:hypothetical protein
MNCGDIVTWKHTFYYANSEVKEKLTTAPEEEQKKIRASHHQEKVWMEEDHLSHAKKFGLGPHLEKL